MASQRDVFARSFSHHYQGEFDMSKPLPQATRRVPLSFDEKGEPGFDTVCSPKSFRARALAIVPPRHVIPVIFVPGTMGTNLRSNNTADSGQRPAWSPPNGTIEAIGEINRRIKQTPAERQVQLSPTRTEVDDNGKIELPDTAYTLTKGEAKRRGWGQLHFNSYGNVLADLERALNDQYEDSGKPGATQMAVWHVAQTLKKDAPPQPYSGEPVPSPPPEQIDVRKVWNAVKGSVTPLTDDEFTRLDDFFYPVWAFGYNWLDSNEHASNRLLNKIDEVLNWYDNTSYFMTQGKVILVTHSMGGIVARRAAQKDASKILGVVHSVQPAAGAPVLYRRFRAGVEVDGFFDFAGAAVATIVGWDAADTTCVLANSPGALELLPTKNYPPGWLTVSQTFSPNSPAEVATALPLKDPYSEIYSMRVQDVWWGMVDETLIDPAKLSDPKKGAFETYMDTLRKVREFHDNLGLYCHPNTYANYGADHREMSFGGVHWSTDGDLYGATQVDLMKLQASSWKLDGDTILTPDGNPITFKLINKPRPVKDGEPDAGDGTVPTPSGASITVADGAQAIFSMKGFDHQGSFSHPDVFDNVLDCIGKIVQLAIPAKDLPSKNGGKPCSE
jgi:pimeloyl-ACP methyl ester carboxylesterase